MLYFVVVKKNSQTFLNSQKIDVFNILFEIDIYDYNYFYFYLSDKCVIYLN